jgi:hypothetical protein
MALLDSEVARIKYELGFNLMGIGAEPRIDVVAVFEQVIQPYILSGATTTTSTAVVGTGSPVLTTLTLANVTGFSVGDIVVVDVDSRQERATIESISGSTISALLSLSHSGTYAVTVEGGETIVRQILRRLMEIAGDGGQLSQGAATAGLKRVDEIEFGLAGGSTKGRIDELKELRMYWRDELASALGVPNMWQRKISGGQRCSLY